MPSHSTKSASVAGVISPEEPQVLTYAECQKKGYDFVVGVPCSCFKQFIVDLQADPRVRYIPATKEDTAVALAVGAYFSGRKPLVFLQNSGLGNIVNIVSSLLIPYAVPIDFLISMREKPFEHTHMYKISKDIISLLELDANVHLVDSSHHS